MTGAPQLYYKHSGRIGPLGLVLVPTASLAAAALLGAVYGYGLYYIPSVYLSAVLCVLFGGGIGYAVTWSARVGKVRSGSAVAAFACLAGLAGEYFGWVSWFSAVTGGTTSFELAVIWEAASKLAETGAWSIWGWTPRGAALYAIWALEALVIVGASTLYALGSHLSSPFCEKCERWTQSHGALPRLKEAADPSDLRLQLEQGHTSALRDLGKAMPGASAFTELDIQTCPKCRQLSVLYVKAVTVTKGSRGEPDRSESVIVDGLLLDASAVAVVKAL